MLLLVLVIVPLQVMQLLLEFLNPNGSTDVIVYVVTDPTG